MWAGRGSFVRRLQCASAARNRSTSSSRDALRQTVSQATLRQADQYSHQSTAAAAAGSRLCVPRSSDAVQLRIANGSLSAPDSASRVNKTPGSSSSQVQSRGSRSLSAAASETLPTCTAATDIGPVPRRRRLPQSHRNAIDSTRTASRGDPLPQSQTGTCTQLQSVIEPPTCVPQQVTLSSSNSSSTSTSTGSSSSSTSTSTGSSSSVIAPANRNSIITSHNDGTLCSGLPPPTLENLTFKDSAFTPRDFQVEAIQCIVEEWQAGSSVQMVMMPTGSGKTVVMGYVARFLSENYFKVAALAHPDETQKLKEPNNTSSNSKQANFSVPASQGSEGELGAVCGRRSTIDSAADHPQDASRITQPGASAKAAALSQLLASAAPASDPAGGTCIQPDAFSGGTTSRGSERSGRKRSSKSAIRGSSQTTDQTAESASHIGDEAASMPAPACNPGQDQTCAVPFRQGGKDVRVLLLAHRHELLQQAEEKFQLIWPGATASWVKGKRKEFWGQVVLASVQTAVNCLEQLVACGFSLVLIDEAHHSVANSYLQVLKGFGFVKEVAVDQGTLDAYSGNGSAVDSCDSSWYEDLTSDSSNSSSSSSGSSSGGGTSSGTSATRMQALYSPDTLLVGFTATPYRLKKEDSEQLYEIFQPTYTQNINDMIQRKYLSQIHSRKIFTNTDLKGVHAVNGDFTSATLSPLVNSSTRNNLVLDAFLGYCTEPAASGAGSGEPGSQGVHAVSHTEGSTSSTNHSSNSSSSSNTNGTASTDQQLPARSMTGRRVTRKAIGFAVDICHAETLNARFLDAGVKSGVIHSKRPVDENAQLLQELKHGQLDIVWNVEKLTEGFDEPSLNAVLMVRPTRSTGLYTQMLGRGLRRWPGKENCLVLDFTDKYHKADRTMDLRVLLGDDGPYTNLDPQLPEWVDRQAKVDSKGEGGEMSVLGDDMDPKDLAWKQFGSHWMCNLFDIGSVWLVNVAEIGSKQRQMLGLRAPRYRTQEAAAAVAGAMEGNAGSPTEHSSSDQELMGWQAGPEGLGDRYVVLHQLSSRDHSPFTWSNGAPSAVHGMKALDAYGAALDYMETLIRKQRQMAIRSWKKGHKNASPPAQLTTFRRDAAWRRAAMGHKQIEFLQKLKVPINPNWTKGEASNAIAAALCKPATDKQHAQLQEKLGADEYNNLPAPLLAAFAASLGAADDA